MYSITSSQLTSSQLVDKVLPICLALSPIGLLFGILAGQQGIEFYEVLLLSTFGFSGSGQFAFLGFYQNNFSDVGYILAFLIILSINVRYIPMALVNNPNKRNLKKVIYSHMLSDESFTIENSKYSYELNFKIRLYIFFTWVISTLIGQIVSSIIPTKFLSYLNISFPIAAILFTLSFINIKSETTKSNIVLIGFLFIITIFLFFTLGSKFFWVPSILINYFVLRKFR